MVKLSAAIFATTLCVASPLTFANNQRQIRIIDASSSSFITCSILSLIQMALERKLKGPPSPFKGRGLVLLNVAIYNAMLAAEKQKQQFKSARQAIENTLIEVWTLKTSGFDAKRYYRDTHISKFHRDKICSLFEFSVFT